MGKYNRLPMVVMNSTDILNKRTNNTFQVFKFIRLQISRRKPVTNFKSIKMNRD